MADYTRVDGSLSLLRRHGPLDTADEVAATLAALPSCQGVVVIGADAVLDQALARHGLPVSGESGGTTASSRLLNFVIESAFCPMEIGFLHALLTLELCPIARGLAVNLVRALQDMPGRGTETFNKTVQEAVAAAPEDQRAGLQDRVTHLLMPATLQPDGTLSLQAVEPRIATLEIWARSRVAFAPTLFALLGALARFRAALATVGESTFSRQTLRRLCSEVGADTWTFCEGQAGLVHVRQPGCVLSPADTVVWWNFSRATAPRPQRLFLTEVERTALDSLGVGTPDARLMNAHADAWQRPLMQAQSRLLLVCPDHDDAGDRAELHPLWDEIMARMSKGDTAARLVIRELTGPHAARVEKIAARPLVQPALELKTKAPLKLRDVESPSSLERLLGCSLSWSLHYVGKIRSGLSSPVPTPTPLLFGTLAHGMLEQVLLRPHQTEDEAARFAAELFDGQAKDRFEALHLPAHQAEKAHLRLVIVESARALVRLARDHKAVILGTEVTGQVTASGQIFAGNADFVWKTPAVVLDLKWGKRTPAEKLHTGTHLQLAAYAAMHAVRGKFPEVAYFALSSQKILAEPNGILQRDGAVPGVHTADSVWKATMTAFEKRRTELGAGTLVAPGATNEEEDSVLSGSTLMMSASCTYCDFAALCGRGAAT